MSFVSADPVGFLMGTEPAREPASQSDTYPAEQPPPSLRGLGLDHVSEHVYRRILREPRAGVPELSAECGISESETRSALDELIRVSLLRPSWEDPAVLIPISPDVGLTGLLAEQQQILARRQQEIEASRAAVAKLVADYDELLARQPGPDVERLYGTDNIRLRIEKLSCTCQDEAVSLIPGGAQTRANMDASRALDEDALNRGVRIRTVLLDSIRIDPPTLTRAQWMTQLGAEVRTAPDLPLRMLVVDGESAIVPAATEDGDASALLLHNHAVVAALHALFTSIWRAARPLGNRHRRRDSRGLTDQQSAILNLLVQGCTDEFIARRLGFSARTVRRVIAELMERLDARSRFQAGARAQAENWLDPP